MPWRRSATGRRKKRLHGTHSLCELGTGPAASKSQRRSVVAVLALGPRPPAANSWSTARAHGRVEIAMGGGRGQRPRNILEGGLLGLPTVCRRTAGLAAQ